MTKSKSKETSEERAQRKLADAQAKLQSAQARRARAVTKGELEVERARERAAARVERTTREVERRAGKVARAEARLSTVRYKQASKQSPKRTPVPPLLTPEEAADELEILVLESDSDEEPPEILIPTNAADIADDDLDFPGAASDGINAEGRLLAALTNGASDGATFTEWLAGSGVSKKTFLRLRQDLVDRGLVTRDGSGRGARYRLASGATQVQTSE